MIATVFLLIGGALGAWATWACTRDELARITTDRERWRSSYRALLTPSKREDRLADQLRCITIERDKLRAQLVRTKP